MDQGALALEEPWRLKEAGERGHANLRANGRDHILGKLHSAELSVIHDEVVHARRSLVVPGNDVEGIPDHNRSGIGGIIRAVAENWIALTANDLGGWDLREGMGLQPEAQRRKEKETSRSGAQRLLRKAIAISGLTLVS